jgi:hypothetical protein
LGIIFADWIGKKSNNLDKSLNVDFIKVQNPPNFKNKNAFSLDHFLLKIGVIDSNLIKSNN